MAESASRRAVICRYCSGAYAEGARAGAPDAIQVADRWHLWHNLAECAGKTVAPHRGCLTPPPARPKPPPRADKAGSTRSRRFRRTASRRVRPGTAPGDPHPRALRRHPRPADAGQSQADICRATGLDLKTVQRFARAASIGNFSPGSRTGTRSSTRSSPTCANGGTRASPTPPRSTPSSSSAAGPAATGPSAATSRSSGNRAPPPARRPPCRRPGRLPACAADQAGQPGTR